LPGGGDTPGGHDDLRTTDGELFRHQPANARAGASDQYTMSGKLHDSFLGQPVLTQSVGCMPKETIWPSLIARTRNNSPAISSESPNTGLPLWRVRKYWSSVSRRLLSSMPSRP